MLYAAFGGPDAMIDEEELVRTFVRGMKAAGAERNLLLAPPDGTRAHSGADVLVRGAYREFGGPERGGILAIIPALGTHRPMGTRELEAHFGDVPTDLFAAHDPARDTVTVGEFQRRTSRSCPGSGCPCPGPAKSTGRSWIAGTTPWYPSDRSYLTKSSAWPTIRKYPGRPWRAPKHRPIALAGSRVRSRESHGSDGYPGPEAPERGRRKFLSDVRIVYALTVVGRDAGGNLVYRGLFIGDDEECYRRAAELSRAGERPDRSAPSFVRGPAGPRGVSVDLAGQQGHLSYPHGAGGRGHVVRSCSRVWNGSGRPGISTSRYENTATEERKPYGRPCDRIRTLRAAWPRPPI